MRRGAVFEKGATAVARQLFFFQGGITLGITTLEWLGRGSLPALSALVGGSISILVTIAAMVIFAALPRVVPSKIFYLSIILHEFLKWVMVFALGIIVVRLHIFLPVDLLIGFALSYLGYFAILFWG